MPDEHRRGIAIEAWGTYACFTRPEFGAERMSYPCITPSAAQGIISRIYWHPGIKWHCTEIRICNPIRYYTVCKIENSATITAASIKSEMRRTGKLSSTGNRQQRYSTLLMNCKYQLFYEFDINPDDLPDGMSKSKRDLDLIAAKTISMTAERVKRGGCYITPSFGAKQYVANFRPLPKEEEYICPEELRGTVDFGIMLYDMDYSKTEPEASFFRCIAHDGVIEVPSPDSKEVYRL